MKSKVAEKQRLAQLLADPLSAPIHMLPIPLVMLAWDEDWRRVLSVWFLSSMLSYFFCARCCDD